MGEGVVAQVMPGGQHVPEDLLVSCDAVALHEKGGANAVPGQHIQQAQRAGGVHRAVKGEIECILLQG
ncbi:hypothetical protein SDC9_170402 [bioreactor metagenome]|uniref:Uncharacterized protein n=1 Tax=bioreactor metagenome TaxID=1076179 RepID=A0A645G7Y3_9ZZZZ